MTDNALTAKTAFEKAAADLGISIEYQYNTDGDETNAKADVRNRRVMVEFGPGRTEREAYAAGFHELGHIVTAHDLSTPEGTLDQFALRAFVHVPGVPSVIADMVIDVERRAWEWAEANAPAELTPEMKTMRALSEKSYADGKAKRERELTEMLDMAKVALPNATPMEIALRLAAFQVKALITNGESAEGEGCGKCPACLRRKAEADKARH